MPQVSPLTAVLAVALAPSALAQFETWEDTMSLGIDDLAITPDGRRLVLRDGSLVGSTIIVDLTDGAELLRHDAPVSSYTTGAPCVDAVEVTDARAVSLATTCTVFDLTPQTPTVLAEHDLGETPRDLALTPDGGYALVRGGTLPLGGVHVIDLASGALVVDRPVGVQHYLLTGNDLCDADDAHGVALSYDVATNTTHVHVVEFAAAGGPAIVFETIGQPGLAGHPMDVDLSPDGLRAAVRSETEVAIVRLDGTNTTVEMQAPAAAGASASPQDVQFDSVWMTNDLLVTASPVSPVNSGSTLDVLDTSGTRWTVAGLGLLHDLCVTPDGTRVVTSGDLGLDLVDLTALPAGGGALGVAAHRPLNVDGRGLFGGIDSIECTADLCVTVFSTPSGTRARAYALPGGTAPGFVVAFAGPLAGRPLDVTVTPDGHFAAFVAQGEYVVADLRTGTERLRVQTVAAGGGWPWGDAAVSHPEQIGVGGIAVINASLGWGRSVDLVSRADVVCQPGANSTGAEGETFVLGSTRVAAGDLELHARNVTPGEFGIFRYGDAFGQSMLGGALVCVAGATDHLGVVTTSPEGTVAQPLDLGMTPGPGGGFAAGSTWFVQFVHRDAGGVGAASALSLLLQ